MLRPCKPCQPVGQGCWLSKCSQIKATSYQNILSPAPSHKCNGLRSGSLNLFVSWWPQNWKVESLAGNFGRYQMDVTYWALGRDFHRYDSRAAVKLGNRNSERHTTCHTIKYVQQNATKNCEIIKRTNSDISKVASNKNEYTESYTVLTQLLGSGHKCETRQV